MKRRPVHDSPAQRHVRLFRNGRNKALIRKEGERLIVEPVL